MVERRKGGGKVKKGRKERKEERRKGRRKGGRKERRKREGRREGGRGLFWVFKIFYIEILSYMHHYKSAVHTNK